jgi:hypothetical protein
MLALMNNKDAKSYVEILGVKLDTSELVKDRFHVYKPFHDIGLELPNNPFWLYNRVAWIKSKKLDLAHGPSRLTWDNLQDHLIVRDFHGYGKVSQLKLDYLKFRCRQEKKEHVYFIKRYERPTCSEITDVLGFKKYGVARRKGTYFHKQDLFVGNWMTKWLFFKTQMEIELFMHSIAIEDVEVPKDFEEEWKAARKVNSTRMQYDLETEIPVEDIRIRAVASRKRALHLLDLNNGKGFILWGFSEQKEALENWAHAFSAGKFKDMVRIYQIRQKDEKHFVPVKNAINVDVFMSHDTPIFKEVATALVINESPIWRKGFYPLAGAHQSLRIHEASARIAYIFFPLAETVNDLYVRKTNTINMFPYRSTEEQGYKAFLDEVKTIALENDWVDQGVIKNVAKVTRYFDGLDLMEYIAPEPDAVPYIAEYFASKGKPVDPIWTDPKPWELDLLKELQAKFNYKKLVADTEYRSDRYSTKGEIRAALRNNLNAFVSKHDSEVQLFKQISKYHDKAIKASV